MNRFNVCLIMPNNYIHSYAFLELGELLLYSLRDLGFEASMAFNNIISNGRNIIIGCHLLESNLIDNLPKSTIILNTEQISALPLDWDSNILKWARVFEVWDYSEKNIRKFNELGFGNVKFFKIGFQKQLARLKKNIDQDVDVLFFGSLNERRARMIQKFEEHKVKVKILLGVYGEERDRWIERSKVVLNCHFYNTEIFEIVRVFYLLTNAVAVVGEVNETTSISSFYRAGIYEAKYDDLIEKCLSLVNNDVLRRTIEEAAITTITKFPQRKFTQELLDF